MTVIAALCELVVVCVEVVRAAELPHGELRLRVHRRLHFHVPSTLLEPAVHSPCFRILAVCIATYQSDYHARSCSGAMSVGYYFPALDRSTPSPLFPTLIHSPPHLLLFFYFSHFLFLVCFTCFLLSSIPFLSE